MTRLPFDPSKMTGVPPRRADGPSGAGAGAISVSRLGDLIAGTLRDGLPRSLRVIGEVSGFKHQTHWYFQLKDDGAIISCAMWANAARRAEFEPRDGMQVIVTGRVEFWGKGGRTQFYVERIEPVGEGALDLKFRQLCEELRRLGWLDPARKRPLPRFPRRIAVLTSRTGAALQDVLDTARRRCPAVEIAVIDVRVQGDGAAEGIARALRWVSTRAAALGIDAVLLTRGGGSKEDLWAFNERIVAEAIVACSVPVAAAIGHEVDTTIAELVADERCATPTQAAMRLTPDRDALAEQLDALAGRLTTNLVRHLRHERERLRSAARHPFFTDPASRVRAAQRVTEDLRRRLAGALRQACADASRCLERASARLERHRPAAIHARRRAELAALTARLASACRARCERLGLEIDAAARALELVGPVSVLRRGFSCTLRADGTVIRSIHDVQTGEPVRTRVLDGSFVSMVVGGEAAADTLTRRAAEPPAPMRAATASKRRKRPPRLIVAEPGLFDSTVTDEPTRG